METNPWPAVAGGLAGHFAIAAAHGSTGDPPVPEPPALMPPDPVTLLLLVLPPAPPLPSALLCVPVVETVLLPPLPPAVVEAEVPVFPHAATMESAMEASAEREETMRDDYHAIARR
jgi:hypothetical protein